MKKLHLWVLLLYPWMIGCSTTNTLRMKDESYIEAMGGSGVTTETMYEWETIPTCDSKGTDRIKAAIGKYDSRFADVGIRGSHYDASNGFVIEGGGGLVTTVSRTAPRDLRTAPSDATNVTAIEDALQTPYIFCSMGKDHDYYGWRLGFFAAAPQHYDDQLIIPTFRLRWGRIDKFRFEIGFMNNPTYMSSGCLADAGFKLFAEYLKTDLYFGAGITKGYTKGQLLFQTETHTTKNLSIKASANFGVIAGSTDPADPFQLGFGLGIKYQW